MDNKPTRMAIRRWSVATERRCFFSSIQYELTWPFLERVMYKLEEAVDGDFYQRAFTSQNGA